MEKNKMKLVADIGNTSITFAIFQDKNIIQKFKIDNEALEDLQYIERLVIDGQIVKNSRDNSRYND